MRGNLVRTRLPYKSRRHALATNQWRTGDGKGSRSDACHREQRRPR